MALGQHLERVSVGVSHDPADRCDVRGRDGFVEQVAHGVDENPAGAPPRQRLVELLRHQAEVETLLERMSGDPAEAFGECLRVTVCAAGADLGATANRVPGGVGPLNP